MIAPTIVIITLAMAEMMALIPRPIAEKIEPWIGFQGQKLEAKLRGGWK